MAEVTLQGGMKVEVAGTANHVRNQIEAAIKAGQLVKAEGSADQAGFVNPVHVVAVFDK